MSLLTGTGKPRVILGLMTFGDGAEAVSAGARITTLEGYTQILDHLQGAGYNEVDTARVYIDGKQEAFTKKAQWKERGLTLATKVYPKTPGIHKSQAITEQFEISLKELGSDCVDIFYLHAADRSVPFTETLSAVDKLHKQGKFVQLGLSNFTAFEVAEIVMHCKYNNWVRGFHTASPDDLEVRPTIYQGMYNAITRSLEKELIPACKRYGIDVVVYNPLAGGLFSGKYKTSDIPTEGRFSDSTTSMGAMYRARYYKDSTFEALSVIEPVVEKHGLTMVDVALRWVVNHSALHVKDGNDGVIVGVSSLQQLDQNLKGCEAGPLPDEVVEALDKAWKISEPDTPNYWHLDLKYSYDTRKALFNV